ncbi:MAG: glycosyltransferase 87 family protein [Actinomycetota bacterium]|nr:glycosyltransferase 87 family protein [Actinomycetota bacterium]
MERSDTAAVVSPGLRLRRWRPVRLHPLWVPGIAFCVFVCCELMLVVVLAAGRSPLVPGVHGVSDSIAGPFAHLGGTVLQGDNAYRWAFAGLVLAMGACYAILAAHSARLSQRWWLLAIAIASAVIVLGPPLLLTDSYNYLSFARLGVLHGLNPYTHPPADAMTDPFFPLASWHRQPTPYGPLFTLLTYPLAWLGIAGGLWALKAATVAAGVGAVAVLGRCARRLGQSPSRAAVLLGLNPIVLVYGMGGVHNDFFMELAFLGAVYFVLAERERAAGWAGAAAAGLKASAIPLLPFLVLGARRRLSALAWMLGGAAAVAAVTLVAFGDRAPGLAQQQASVTRFSLPHIVSALLGHAAYRRCPAVYVCATPATEWGATVVFGLGLLALLWWAWRGADWITCAGWAAILFVLTLTAVMPWYLVWVLPLAILSRSSRLRTATGALAGFLLFTTQPFQHLIPYIDHRVVAHFF